MSGPAAMVAGHAIVSTPETSYVAWIELEGSSATVNLTRLAPDGQTQGDATQVSSSTSAALLLSMAMTPTELGIAYSTRDGQLRFIRAGHDGFGITDRPLVEGVFEPRVVFDGTNYVIVSDSASRPSHVQLLKLSALGEPLGPPVRLTSEATPSYPTDLLWTGTDYAIALVHDYERASRPAVMRVSTDLQTIGAPAFLSDRGENPRLAVKGRDLFVTWDRGRSAHLNPDGTIAAGPFTNAIEWTNAMVVAEASQYTIVWGERRSEEALLSRVVGHRGPLPSIRISRPGAMTVDHKLSWDGVGTNITWMEREPGFFTLHFARVCPQQ